MTGLVFCTAWYILFSLEGSKPGNPYHGQSCSPLIGNSAFPGPPVGIAVGTIPQKQPKVFFFCSRE